MKQQRIMDYTRTETRMLAEPYTLLHIHDRSGRTLKQRVNGRSGDWKKENIVTIIRRRYSSAGKNETRDGRNDQKTNKVHSDEKDDHKHRENKNYQF